MNINEMKPDIYKEKKGCLDFWNVKHSNWQGVRTAFPKTVIEAVKAQEFESVLDYGCNDARSYKTLFIGKKYCGVDILDIAINQAKKNVPSGIFEVIPPNTKDWNSYTLPKVDLLWIYTVLVHVHPDDIVSMIDILLKCCKQAIIVECWQKKIGAKSFNSGYCYNHDYEKLLKPYDVLDVTEHGKLGVYLVKGKKGASSGTKKIKIQSESDNSNSDVQRKRKATKKVNSVDAKPDVQESGNNTD